MRTPQAAGRFTLSKKLEERLKKDLRRLKASSATFYVKDPWYRNELRLIFMPGVRVVELMHGFVLPTPSAQRMGYRSRRARAEQFFPDAGKAAELRDHLDFPREGSDPSALLANFVDREGVASCARFVLNDSRDTPKAVLWINFRKRTDLDKLKPALRAIARRLWTHVDTLIRHLESAPPFPMPQMSRILSAMERLTVVDDDPSTFLNEVLGAALESFKITPEDGWGAILKFERHSRTLTTAAHSARGVSKVSQRFTLNEKTGALSWVALNRRSLLLRDLQSSEFVRKGMYVPGADGMKSALIAPIVAGEELEGVLIMESRRRPSPFTPDNVRPLWFMASQAALAYRLSRQTRWTRMVLQTAHTAAVQGQSSKALSELAKLACQWVGAAACEMWLWNPAGDSFEHYGSSDEGGGPVLPPSRTGWTRWIHMEARQAWISNVVSITSFDKVMWDPETKGWITPASKHDLPVPRKLSPRVLDFGSGASLGLPIRIHDQAIGVAWLRFLSGHERPTPGMIDVVSQFAAQAGLVMDVMRHHEELLKQQEWAKEIRERLLCSGPIPASNVDAHVIHLPHEGPIGGDYFKHWHVDEYRSCFLLGDAVGHGKEASRLMLPMLGTADWVQKDVLSTKLILLKIQQLCRSYSLLKTSLLCFYVDSEGRTPVVFASAMGELELVILKKYSGKFEYLPVDKGHGPSLYGLSEKFHITEEMLAVDEGDLLVACTDGVKEAGVRPEGFGMEGIEKIVLANKIKPVAKIARAIAIAARKRAGGAFEDDVTIIVARVRKPKVPK